MSGVDDQLIGPRWRVLKSALRDRERLSIAKAKRRIRKAGKAHSTNRERSYMERERAAKTAIAVRNRDDSARAFKDAVRAYWRGERDTYPERTTSDD